MWQSGKVQSIYSTTKYILLVRCTTATAAVSHRIARSCFHRAFQQNMLYFTTEMLPVCTRARLCVHSIDHSVSSMGYSLLNLLDIEDKRNEMVVTNISFVLHA